LSTNSSDDLSRLATRQHCPLCEGGKTTEAALCRKCRMKLPPHMRTNLTAIRKREPGIVAAAIRQAVRYIDVHFQSIRNFGGGRRR
jgi:hypothetical protein